jgi:uncharacterized glyoxalase superfamily protein PhnB
MAIEGSVPGMGQIVPHPVVSNTEEALAFYQRAFGAEVLYRSASPSGDGEHIHLKVWGSLIQVAMEEPGQRQRVLRERCSSHLRHLAVPRASSRCAWRT